MSAKRFTGKTESDAVMNAAMELGIPSTDLKYTVIDSGSNGFLGLFKKPVIIEIKEEEKETEVMKWIKIQKQRQEENTLTLILRKLDGRLARTVLQKCQLQVCQTVQEKVMPIMFYTAIMENHWQSSKQNEAV